MGVFLNALHRASPATLTRANTVQCGGSCINRYLPAHRVGRSDSLPACFSAPGVSLPGGGLPPACKGQESGCPRISPGHQNHACTHRRCAECRYTWCEGCPRPLSPSTLRPAGVPVSEETCTLYPHWERSPGGVPRHHPFRHGRCRPVLWRGESSATGFSLLHRESRSQPERINITGEN